MIKQRLYATRLPRLKPIVERNVRIKHPSPHQPERYASTVISSTTCSTSSRSNSTNHHLVPSSSKIDALPSIISCTSTGQRTVQPLPLRKHTADRSYSPSPIHSTKNTQSNRTKLYKNIPAKINTGLPRTDTTQPSKSHTHQLEPNCSVNWFTLKHELENDLYIRTHAKRTQFNSGTLYASQITTLGNLIRSKVRGHLSSKTIGDKERYKIVVHLTVFPTIAAGLHVASRCLWNAHTDNSITIRMQGVDCDILIIVFLCYTDIGTT